jgi:hypothetical protein
VTVTRAATEGRPEGAGTIPAGTSITADQGDYFVGSPHIAVEARNDESERLVLLMRSWSRRSKIVARRI